MKKSRLFTCLIKIFLIINGLNAAALATYFFLHSSLAKDAVPSSQSETTSDFYLYDFPEQQQSTDKYVLNTATYKFHSFQCNDVRRISPENYATSNSSYSELTAQGYQPCAHCNPLDTETYILDTSTGYFHLSNHCKFIKSEDTCTSLNGSKEELSAQGYYACYCVETDY